MELNCHLSCYLIAKGIEKGKIGRKIEVRFSELDVDVKEYLITRDNLQIILFAQAPPMFSFRMDCLRKRKRNLRENFLLVLVIYR